MSWEAAETEIQITRITRPQVHRPNVILDEKYFGLISDVCYSNIVIVITIQSSKQTNGGSKGMYH